MIKISLCMIVKNEEQVLDRCLNSVKDIADEIIIVDTGSRDRTKEVAAAYTDKIYDFVWIDDFAAARNYASSAANASLIAVTNSPSESTMRGPGRLDISASTPYTCPFCTALRS